MFWNYFNKKTSAIICHGGFQKVVFNYFFPELLTNAMDLLSGDQEGTLMVP